MDNDDLLGALLRIRKAVKKWRPPALGGISRKRNPFKTLVGCILSLRTRDEVTEAASEGLYWLADTPRKLLAQSTASIEKAIYPVAFYRNKARTLKELCHTLIQQHGGKVPDTLEELLKLKGVGRKTANLTMILGFKGMGICVDTHVHRIANRWGYVKTQIPDETEMALRKKLPKKYWREINALLVPFGQNLCKPVSPHCSECPISEFCKKRGVEKYR